MNCNSWLSVELLFLTSQCSFCLPGGRLVASCIFALMTDTESLNGRVMVNICPFNFHSALSGIIGTCTLKDTGLCKKHSQNKINIDMLPLLSGAAMIKYMMIQLEVKFNICWRLMTMENAMCYLSIIGNYWLPSAVLINLPYLSLSIVDKFNFIDNTLNFIH